MRLRTFLQFQGKLNTRPLSASRIVLSCVLVYDLSDGDYHVSPRMSV
jgi:hypothetical protein